MGKDDKNAGVTQLLPCPKCQGAGKLHVSSDGEVEWVRCASCGLDGTAEFSPTEAVKAWNGGQFRQASIAQHEGGRGKEYNHNDTLARRMGGRWIEREPHPSASVDRNAVLEEAAKVAESEAGTYAEDGEGDAWIALRIARAIRALRSTETPAQEGE